MISLNSSFGTKFLETLTNSRTHLEQQAANIFWGAYGTGPGKVMEIKRDLLDNYTGNTGELVKYRSDPAILSKLRRDFNEWTRDMKL